HSGLMQRHRKIPHYRRRLPSAAGSCEIQLFPLPDLSKNSTWFRGPISPKGCTPPSLTRGRRTSRCPDPRPVSPRSIYFHQRMQISVHITEAQNLGFEHRTQADYFFTSSYRLCPGATMEDGKVVKKMPRKGSAVQRRALILQR